LFATEEFAARTKAKYQEESAVKSLYHLALTPLVALALASLPPATAQAQTAKPVAVVSIASIKENLADIGYITRAAGMADYGDTAKFFASALAAGLDKERPIGLYVVPKAGDFHAVAFVPLEANGLDTILKVHKEQLGEPKDAGNGIREVGNTKTAFIKEQAGWAFIAESKEYLTSLPQDPIALLGDLPQKYNIAGKLLVQNIPEELRRMGIDEIKLGMERFLDSPAARQGNIDRDQARQLTKAYLGNIEKLINEADEVLVGLGIDEMAKHVVLDIGFSGKEGSSLARSMAAQADAKTNFAGFMLPEASVTMSLASKTSPEDIEQVKPALQAARVQWSKQIDDSPDIPGDKREAIKGALGQLFDVIEKTVATGRMDGGGALVLLPKSVAFAFGGAVEDGAGVDKVLKSVVDLGVGIPNFPQIKLNAGSIGDYKLNRLTAPIPGRNDDARELLGDNLEIIIGVGPKSVIVSGGRDAEALLKKVIDRSAQEKEKAISPLSINVALLPILKFYKSVDDNPIVGNVLASLEKSGNDRVTIVNQAAPRSSTTRIEIQEGVIKAIGEGAKSAGVRPGR
jgi:hypothetical protein